MKRTSSRWRKALYLQERLVALPWAIYDPNLDHDLANRRFQKWRSQLPFEQDGYFQQRLQMDGLDEARFLRLLGTPGERLPEEAEITPDWISQLEDICERPHGSNGHSKQRENTEQAPPIAEPFIRRGCDALREGVRELRQRHERLPFDVETIQPLFVPTLRQRIGMILIRALVLELNAARVRGYLHGETSEDRFDYFQSWIAQPERAAAFWDEYPVAARLVVTVVEQWVEASLELLHRLCMDWDSIRERLFVSESALLSGVHAGAGDMHRHGRSVTILEFDSGQKIVYKPHSLAVNAHFTQLLRWLNQRGDGVDFWELKVLDRGSHGWTEFIPAGACDSKDQIRRFYQRLGGLVALVHILNATDFHQENLLACGEHPVLIDLESLFHPSLPMPESLAAQKTSVQAFERSPLRTGLLPQRLWVNGQTGGVDLSGFSGSGDQLTAEDVYVSENDNTDEMRFVRKQARVGEATRNRPVLGSDEVTVADYAAEVVAGFEKIYQLILEHRTEFLADLGPLSWFEKDEVRVIIRPTKTYGQVLWNSFHPNVLRDGLDRERVLDRLWAAVVHRPELRQLISAEQEDLRSGDIPLFVGHPSSRSVWTSAGVEIPGFLPEDSITAVRENLRRLSEEDLLQQYWILHGAIASTEVRACHSTAGAGREYAASTAATRDQLLEAVAAIVIKLEKSGFRSHDKVAWMSLTPVSQEHWTVAPIGFDLYGGTAGVALFLGYAAHFLKNPKARALAETAINTAMEQAARTGGSFSSSRSFVAGISGEGGLIYTAAHLGHLWNDSSLLLRTSELIGPLAALIASDKHFDIIHGCAGYICGLLALHDALLESRLFHAHVLEQAVNAGEHLLQKAQNIKQGLAWQAIDDKDALAPLTGFSHGASGVAYAFLRLYAATNDVRYRDAAMQAFHYEQTQYDAEQRNWYDLRKISRKADGQPSFATVWCHGGPGIGLARIHALRSINNPLMQAALQSDLDAALETTLRRGWGGGHCLCHGDLGNLELLLQLHEIRPGEGWLDRATEIAGAVLQSVRDTGWLCGTPSCIEVPDLMLGLSGIGFGLLRLASPETVPSLLLLDPPKISKAGRSVAWREQIEVGA